MSNNTRNGSFGGNLPQTVTDSYNPMNSAVGNHTMNGKQTTFFTDEQSTIVGSNTQKGFAIG